MTPILPPILFLLAITGAPTFDQIKADVSPEHRAKAAVDFAAAEERAAEAAYDRGAPSDLDGDIKDMVAAMELARDSFTAAGKTPLRQPGTFKGVELKSHDILHRLADFRNKMDASERAALDGPIMRVQEIHDAWFDGIMGKRKAR